MNAALCSSTSAQAAQQLCISDALVNRSKCRWAWWLVELVVQFMSHGGVTQVPCAKPAG